MNPKMPTEYLHKQIERDKRQDEAMAALGWIKVQDGMWTKPDAALSDSSQERGTQ